MSFSDFDAHMMEIALAMARRGLGTTAPNPSVGAVVADEATGEVIARGVTQPGGRPHAEVEALRRAGDRAKGATLYVTLEPCAHHGKTPPCADAIVAAGVARVVVGVEDPDPRTRGQGIERIRAAGIVVNSGLLRDEARRVTLGHILRITERRPFVQLKMALGPDGEVPRGANGAALLVTSAEARASAHRLRAEADAILIGAGTLRDDDPALTCRLPGLEARSPIRVVLSRSLDLPMDAKLVRTAREVPTWVMTQAGAALERIEALDEVGVRVIQVIGVSPSSNPSLQGGGDGRLPVAGVLALLADEGITRLMVEGGPSIWKAFSEAGLADEVVLFQAGAAGSEPPPLAMLAGRHAPGLDLALASRRRVGGDAMAVFRVRNSAAE